MNCSIRAYDPNVSGLGEKYEFVQVFPDPYEALREADIAVIMNDNDIFASLDTARIAGLMKNPVILDTKNMLNKNENSDIMIYRIGGHHGK